MNEINEILRKHNIDPESSVGQKLIAKYNEEIKKREEAFKVLEQEVIKMAEKDFEKNLLNS